MRTTLSKRNEIWQLRIDSGRDPVTGKRLQKMVSTGCMRKKDAEAFEKDYLEKIKKNSGQIPSELTVRDLFTRWLESMESRVRVSTLTSYKWAADKHILPLLGNVPLKELTPLHVEDMIKRLRKTKCTTTAKAGRKSSKTADQGEAKTPARTLSATSVCYAYKILSQALTRAVKWRLIPLNPANAVDPPRKNRYEAAVLDIAQLEKLQAAARPTVLYLPILLAITCGLRRGEVCALRWDDVDLDKRTLCVRHSLGRAAGKLELRTVKTTRSERTVKLPKVMAMALKKEKARQAADKLEKGALGSELNFCWCWDDGRPYDPDYLFKKYKDLLAAAKLPPVRFHDLRHSHVTFLLASGVPVKVISERIGHSSVSFTQDVYSHILPHMQEEAADAVDRLFLPDTKK